MDLPEVQASDRVEAAVPYGDAESLERLRERTEDAQTRAAGATTLLDANVPNAPAAPNPRRRTRRHRTRRRAAALALVRGQLGW